LVGRVLDRCQRLAARSGALVQLAVLIRNQCRCIIKYHLAESPDVAGTGESWLQQISAPRSTRFVDVGANVGDWLAEVVALKAPGTFSAIAFEPSDSARVRLQQRFKGRSEITIRPCALGDTAGAVQFFEEENAGKGSSVTPGFLRAAGQPRSVEIRTLDHELAEIGWDRVDFLKIDAEGYDMRVLRGAKAMLQNQRIGIVQFEYNRPWQLAGDTLAGAMQFLSELNYRVWVLTRTLMFSIDYFRYEEYFEYTNYVAVSMQEMPLLEPYVRGTL
jgi:FkbM family methyltransferase